MSRTGGSDEYSNEHDDDDNDDDKYSDDEVRDENDEFLRVGQMVVSKFQAKLYGFQKKSGKVGAVAGANKNIRGKSHKKDNVLSENMESIAKPVRRFEDKLRGGQFGKDSERVNCTFKPSKSKAAVNAMHNKDCGYDFLDEPEDEEGKGGGPVFKGSGTDLFLKRMDNKVSEAYAYVKCERSEIDG